MKNYRTLVIYILYLYVARCESEITSRGKLSVIKNSELSQTYLENIERPWEI